METRTRVFIIAVNRLLLDALTRVLNNKTDIEVAGAAALSGQTLAETKSAQPGVVLLDWLTSSTADLSFLRGLQQGKQPVRVIMTGMEDDEEAFLRSVRLGVVGFVMRDGSAMEVVSAIRSVVQNEAVCPPKLCRLLMQYVSREWTPSPNVRVRVHLGLTRRQQELMPLVAQGMRNKEIAAHLNLSEQTVKNHIHRMLHKLGASDRVEMIELCRRQGAFL